VNTKLFHDNLKNGYFLLKDLPLRITIPIKILENKKARMIVEHVNESLGALRLVVCGMRLSRWDEKHLDGG
jgi:hypothetical protein